MGFHDQAPDPPAFPWVSRWAQLACAADLRPGEPVLIALSGGADSVFLLHLVARAEPRPRVLAVHVEHGLRGQEGRDDAAFCARLCARLSVPFARCEVDLEPEGANLEARAREARYRALADEARRSGIRAVLTGHHEDDALETLLLRMLRGSDLPGLPGLKRRVALGSELTAGGQKPVQVIRPLLPLRREEVRRILRDEGLSWREDSSNQSGRYTRNRVRGGLLPSIEETCGEEGLEGLRAFAQAVESLEDELARSTAHLSWSPALHAGPGADPREFGGVLSRERLEQLAAPLQRRALWRLIHEGTGLPPSRALLAILEDDLSAGRNARRALPGDWILWLRRRDLQLVPPGGRHPDPETAEEALLLPVPGEVRLVDGRRIRAELVEVDPQAPVPRTPVLVELDADGLPAELIVRLPREGDRFHGLGAPGSRSLTRFLADAGVPREDRSRLPVVCSGDELLWVAGVRPSQARRVRPETRVRLRLALRAPPNPPP